MSRKSRDGYCYAILIALPLLIFADVVFLGANFYLRDVPRYFLPAEAVLHDVVAGGELPLWNPRWNGGQPLAANPGFTAFYPMHLLLFLMPLARAFALESVLHYAIAAAGMFALVRFLGAQRAGAIFAAITFAFGGMLVSYSDLQTYLYAVSLFPWVAFFFCRFLERPLFTTFAAAALMLGVLLLVADPTLTLQIGALLATYAMARARAVIRPLLLTACVVAGGVAVGAVQLVPAFDFQRDTPRAHALPYETASLYSMSAGRPLELFFGDVFGRLSADPPQYWADRFAPRSGLPFAKSIYLGLAAAVFVLAGMATRTRGWAYVAAVAVAAYALAVGSNAPLFAVLYRAGFGTLRYPEKFATAAIFVFAAFAGLVFDRVLADAAARKTAASIAAIVAGVALIVYALTFTSLGAHVFSAVFGHGTEPLAAARDGWRNSFLAAAALAVILASPRLTPAMRAALLIAFVCVDLLPRVNGVAPRIDADFYDPPPAARQLAASGRSGIRLYNDKDWLIVNGQSRQPRLPTISGHWASRNSLTMMSPSIWGFDTAIQIDIADSFLNVSRDFTALFGSFRTAQRLDRVSLLLGLAGVSDGLAERVVDPAEIRSSADLRAMQSVSIVPVGAPRAYIATEIVNAPSLDALYRLLLTNRPFPRAVAFVPSGAFLPAPARIASFAQTANTVSSVVESGGKTLLVFAITAHRHWHATIDGKAVPIVPANHAFQAVVVPAGRHEVRLRYANPIFTGSAIASLLGVATLVFGSMAYHSLTRKA